jgi:hypothetical protein
MLEDLNLSQTASARSGSLELWFKALTSPTIQTYQQIFNHPDASLGKALYWLFLTGGFGGLIASLVQSAFNTNSFLGLSGFQISESISSSAVIWAFLSAGLFAVGVPLITLINTGLVRLAARGFGEKPSYSKLFFAFAAYQAPLGLLICLIGGIPTLGCIALPMTIYWLLLGVQVTRAACDLGAGKAVICILSPFAMGAVFSFCVMVGMLATQIEIV